MTSPATINLRYVMFLACTAALGGLLFGFDIAIITGAGPFIAQHFMLGDIGLGWAFSSLLVGCGFGCFIAGRLADRYGRKKLLLVVALLFGITSIATALSGSFAGFITARFLGGLAVGGVSLLSPMYVAEVSPPSIRGRLGALYQLSIIIGILVSYAINYLLRNEGTSNWRWMFLTGVIPAAIFLLFICFAPETPRFMALNGKIDEAFALLQRIGGTESARKQITEITETLPNKQPAWRALLRPGVSRAVAVSACLAILIHVSGINTIVDYAPTIFQSAGWKLDGALASTFMVGVTELLFTIVSFWVIDRYGRKRLYIVGSIGMTFSLLGLVAAIYLDHFRGALVLIFILMYLAFFASCIGPVFWTLIPEIFPTDVRALAMTVPLLIQWVANALVVLIFPFAFHVVGKMLTFGFLASMALAQGIFTWLYVPETKNKPLEGIEDIWLATKNSHSAKLAVPHL